MTPEMIKTLEAAIQYSAKLAGESGFNRDDRLRYAEIVRNLAAARHDLAMVARLESKVLR